MGGCRRGAGTGSLPCDPPRPLPTTLLATLPAARCPQVHEAVGNSAAVSKDLVYPLFDRWVAVQLWEPKQA